MTLDQFSDLMQRRGANVPTLANAVKRKVAAAILRGVTYSTPVRTGRARANWQVGLGVPVTAALNVAPGPAGGGAAVSAGEAALGGARPGQDVYISNNVPYIGKLNDGWSAQAPAGFVEAAVNRGSAAMAGAHVIEPL